MGLAAVLVGEVDGSVLSVPPSSPVPSSFFSVEVASLGGVSGFGVSPAAKSKAI